MQRGSARGPDNFFRSAVGQRHQRVAQLGGRACNHRFVVLPASAPAAADDKPSGCKPMPENITVDATAPINIGVLANALFYYRCTDYDDQVKAVLNEASAWVAARALGVDKPAIVLDDETSAFQLGTDLSQQIRLCPEWRLRSESAIGMRTARLGA
jgi:hypothetical protein